MATILMHESAVRIIDRYLTSKNVLHNRTTNSITLKSIPAKCLGTIKAFYWQSQDTYPDLFHYMGN